jgi:hypothetical protein
MTKNLFLVSFSQETSWQKINFWSFGSGRVPEVATSDGHNFSSEFPQKVQFLVI